MATYPSPSATHRTRRQSVNKEWLLSLWQQGSHSRSRLQILGVAVLALGAVTIFLESSNVTSHSVVHQGVELVQFALHSVEETLPDADGEPQDPATPPPPGYFALPDTRMCYYTRDVGLIQTIRNSKKVFCANENGNSAEPSRRTEVSHVDLEEQGLFLRATVFKNDLQLDFSSAKIFKPIKSLAEDGGLHDPRFIFNASMVSCGCDELQSFAQQVSEASDGKSTLRLWDPQFVDSQKKKHNQATLCASPQGELSGTENVIQIKEKTILIARRDDHNPFFQVSNALNSWLLMRSMGWKPEETRVIHMDGGYESPIDALHHRLLSSPDKYEILRGRADLIGRKFQFTNEVLLAPHETTGPMMQHLDDQEPCHDSFLMKDFREKSLQAMGVSADNFDTSRQITVTVITRRNYGGRTVQRRWLNEDEVLSAMREVYKTHNGVPIVIQSIDFVDLSLEEQMEYVLNSDVIIGMHGAGMVNVLWTKPETLVVEIFPKRRYRWGYRNLCQFVGCDWHQFRGGKDTGRGDNASDKTIPVEEWQKFFEPLFQDRLRKLETSKEVQQQWLRKYE